MKVKYPYRALSSKRLKKLRTDYKTKVPREIEQAEFFGSSALGARARFMLSKYKSNLFTELRRRHGNRT